MRAAPGWYPVPDQANTMQYFDGVRGVEGTIPAPGLDLLEQIAGDVRVIRTAALLWMALAALGLIGVVVAILSR